MKAVSAHTNILIPEAFLKKNFSLKVSRAHTRSKHATLTKFNVEKYEKGMGAGGGEMLRI